MMRIEKIILKELDSIMDLILYAELETLTMENEEDEAWIRRKMSRLEASGAEFYGAFEKDNMIGFATILVEDRPEGACRGYGACELLQIGIRHEYRNHGYGSSMLSHIESELRTRKVYSIYLHTYAEDYDVIAFYGKNGYIPRGVVPDVYGPDLEGMLYLSKTLK